MYLLRKYVRQAGAAPLPEPSQPSDPATRWAGDLRRSSADPDRANRIQSLCPGGGWMADKLPPARGNKDG